MIEKECLDQKVFFFFAKTAGFGGHTVLNPGVDLPCCDSDDGGNSRKPDGNSFQSLV